MEDYPAQDAWPAERCLADVRASDVYVGIFAWRYGFVPPGCDRSITEMEYREAVEAGLPRLLFLADEGGEWDDAHMDRGIDGERIQALRRELELARIVGYFRDPHHLASEVLAAIRHHEVNARFSELALAESSDQQRREVESERERGREEREKEEEK